MAQPSKPTVINVDIKGLYLNPSTFGDNVPNGALTVADNVVIDRPGIVETRRGFSNTFATMTNTGVKSLFQYNGVMLAHGTDDQMYADPNGDGNFSAYTGTYEVPNPADLASRIRAVEANKNFYFITSNGTYRLDTPSGTPRLAGSPAGLSGEGVLAGDATGFLPNTSNVAYRVVFGYRDFNNQLILGAPSGRIIVSNNSGSSDNVDLTFQVPAEIQADPTDFIYQVYRSNTSPDLATPPDDEMRLAYEDVCTGTPTITISDIRETNLLGADLYTNAGQEGILQSNFRPPWAADICFFKGFTLYANTRTIQELEATLLASGASTADGIDIGDTITFTEVGMGGATFTLTAAAANNAALGEFAVSNTGSAGYDIEVTASNIATIANQYASNTFLNAYYVSAGEELPGRLLFQRITLDADAFTMASSNTACWAQTLPATSSNNVNLNRIAFSKFNQPDAVPVINYIEAGSQNQPIERIVPLRNGVIVFKPDGVFYVSNLASGIQPTVLDYNVRILAPNTAAELANNVYALTDQGIVAVSDTDAQVMSFVLDKTILANTAPTQFPNLRATAWGISYQSDRKYILSLPTSGIAEQAAQQYTYNHFTQVWTRWTKHASCGIVFRPTNKLYLGSLAGSAPDPDDAYIYEERKSETLQDHADDEYVLDNVTTAYTNIITVNNPTLPTGVTIAAGDTIVQGGTAKARVVSTVVGMTQTVITTSVAQAWTAGNITLYKPITSVVQTIQIDAENPGMNKQFSEIVYVFSDQSFSQLTARISSDMTSVPQLDYLVPTTTGGWGIDPWGTSPWGGSRQGQGKIRRYVPQRIQRCGWLYINLTSAEAFTSFGWSGAQLFFRQTSSRQK